MTRHGMMLTATIVMISAVGGTVHGKMVMQTFPVLADAAPHDVYPAPDGAVWLQPNPPANSVTSIPGPAGRI